MLGGRRVDLGRISVPLLHVIAEHDHIVPYDAAKPLVAMVGSTDKEEVVLKGGHVSVAAGGNAVRRLWPKLDALAGRAIDMTTQVNRGYPRTMSCAGGEVEFRLLTPADEAQVLAFAQQLSTHDLLFLRRDISQPKVVAAWMEATRNDAMRHRDRDARRRHGRLRDASSAMTCHGRAMSVNCASSSPRRCAAWARPEADPGRLRHRARDGPGEAGGADDAWTSAARSPCSKAWASSAEALLRDHVKDRDGKTHDIVILSHDVARFQAQRDAYGLSEAV